MKKLFSILLCAMIAMNLLSGCGASKETTDVSASSGEDTLSVVTTIFPEYDWVREVLGDNAKNAELTLLLDKGVDLHNYQPSAQDIAKISDCDLFIYVGGESDEWVEDALQTAQNPNMQTINLLEVLGDSVHEEELVEGMEAEEEEEDEEEEEEPEYDEHVWLSLKNAQVLCQEIADRLSVLDPENAEQYAENAKTYCNKLSALDAQYQNAVDSAETTTILFGDRFPFRYLADDYGLSYYAAFVGCSAETEASFETITFLANKVDELGLTSILTIETSDQKIAKTISQNTNTKDQAILTMNSLQSTTGQDAQNGVTYLSVMQDNLSVLEQALNKEEA